MTIRIGPGTAFIKVGAHNFRCKFHPVFLPVSSAEVGTPVAHGKLGVWAEKYCGKARRFGCYVMTCAHFHRMTCSNLRPRTEEFTTKLLQLGVRVFASSEFE